MSELEQGGTTADANRAPYQPAGLHWPCLLLGLTCMVLGSFVPTVFANAKGEADHGIATLVFWSMSAGFIRGLGFIPRNRFFRYIFGGWAALLTFAGAALLWARSHGFF